MSGNTFGRLFRVTTFGESHGKGIGAIVDGCPARVALTEGDIQPDLDRRRPGVGRLSTARKEADRVQIVSGVADGLTTGTPIALLFQNTDARPKAYSEMARLYRPSHADFTYQEKYGHRARSGGGRASARETVARVAAGAVARKLLASVGVEIVAWVDRVGDIAADVDVTGVSRADVAAGGEVQCPDLAAAGTMTSLIAAVRKDGDTIGGSIRCAARGVPAGWGDPVFDKLDAQLAGAMLGLPAAKAFSIGSGFAGTRMRGSAHNDPFIMGDDGRVRTTSNFSGGVQGGISNGMPIYFDVGFKPVATHFKTQNTVTESGEATTFAAKGRHDPCVLPRAVVIVEAMCALVLCDGWMRHRAQNTKP